MSIAATRAEPRSLEEVLITSTLENTQGQEVLMDHIHCLSQERTHPQTQLARHPWSDREAATRIHAITSELEICWAEVRRRWAAQRVRLEAALGVDPAAFEETDQQGSPQKAPSATRPHASRRQYLSLAYAS